MFALASPAFADHTEIPARYTCDGEDVSPPLAWSGAPDGTKSFALVVDDPDAPDPKHPKTRWVHWVVFNLPPTLHGLEANSRALPLGSKLGLNDWNRGEYGGPCPPVGRHRYFFKLYALDCPRLDLDHPRREQLEQAMRGHVLGSVELIGTYQKHR